MAIIKKSGVGNILSGTIDGVEYVTTRTGTTYVRAVPQMPARIYKTPKALKRQALFRFIQMHRKYHFATISQSFSSVGSVSAANRYYSVNNKSLRMALDPSQPAPHPPGPQARRTVLQRRTLGRLRSKSPNGFASTSSRSALLTTAQAIAIDPSYISKSGKDSAYWSFLVGLCRYR